MHQREGGEEGGREVEREEGRWRGNKGYIRDILLYVLTITLLHMIMTAS